MGLYIFQNSTWQKASNVKANYNNAWVSGTVNPRKPKTQTAFLLDCGRKYFTIDWLKSIVDSLISIGYDALILHFSEEMGLRLESKMYPWLAGSDGTLCTQAEITDDGKYYTQSEMEEIVTYAMKKGVDVIPSFDSPGHMNYIVKKYNDHYNTDIGNYYHYNGKTHIVEGTRNKNYSRGIDISNTEAVLFTKSLITEYAQFFYNLGCRSFDMGGDELLGYGSAITTSVPKWQQLDHWKEYAIQQTGDSNAVAYDAFLLYMNDVNSLLRNIGYTETRMWNDQIFIDSTTGHNGVVELNKDISIQYWLTTKNTPLQIMQAGHDIYNFISPHNYYVLVTDTSNFTNLELCQEWLLQNFSVYSASEWEYKVKGSAFCVWCDNPTLKTEDEIKEEILPLLSARIEKN